MLTAAETTMTAAPRATKEQQKEKTERPASFEREP